MYNSVQVEPRGPALIVIVIIIIITTTTIIVIIIIVIIIVVIIVVIVIVVIVACTGGAWRTCTASRMARCCGSSRHTYSCTHTHTSDDGSVAVA